MKTKNSAKRRVTLERTYDARIEEIWDLWTTKEGIEAWWGPDGFKVEVLELDLRSGGELRYAMIAAAPAQIEFMKKAGMPLRTAVRITYAEVRPLRRLVYDNLADFIPGVEPYTVATVVELHPGEAGVKMVLTFDVMHDEVWTRRAVMGWESELDKLSTLIERRRRSAAD